MSNKNKTDYEVEGCWSGLKTKTKCRLCGTLFVPVPKEGHNNSHYWELQRHDNEQLVCCPKGCDVTLAEKRIKEFSKLRKYCTEESESWNYKLDYSIIKHAWINTEGKVYPLDIRGHVEFAQNIGESEHSLEMKGWLKLSNNDLHWENCLSKKQIDFVFDYLVANNCENQTKEFMERAEYKTCMFKIERNDNAK